MEKKVTFVWNDADVEPDDFEQPVVYCTYDDKISALKNTYGMYGGDETKKHSKWDWLKEKYNIKYWVYKKDIL